MRVSPELAAALESIDEHLEPGERVPEKWDELPQELRDRLKTGLAGSPDVQFGRAFAEFVQAYLIAYRREEMGRTGLHEY